MKYKIIGFITIVIMIGFAVYFFAIHQNRAKVNINSYEEFQQKIDDEDSFILVLGNSICQGCDEYKKDTLTKYVRKYSQKDLIVLYSDKSFTDITFEEFLEEYGTELNFTPTTYYFKEGLYIANENSRWEGVMTLEELEAFIALNE